MSDQPSAVRFVAADGWELSGLLRVPAGGAGEVGGVGGVVFVPGSRHERDAWTDTAGALAEAGVASLTFDIRGRGASLGPTAYSRLPIGLRRRVSMDVAAALDALASALEGRSAGPDPAQRPAPLAVVAEQDTAPDAAAAAAGDARVVALAVLSARGGERLVRAVSSRPLPVYGLVSTEDRAGVRATVDAYLAGTEEGSRLDVFDGLGFGITMASVRRFEHPDDDPIESLLATWLADRLA